MPERHFCRQVHLRTEVKLQNLSRLRSADRASIGSHWLPSQGRDPCSRTGYKRMVKLGRRSVESLGDCTSNGYPAATDDNRLFACPVIKLDASEAKNRSAPASSCGLPILPIHVNPLRRSRNALSC